MCLLRDSEKHTLLEIARDAVTAYLAGIPIEFPDVSDGNLTRVCGVFVSLHRGSQLRGCIGNIQPEWPLYVTAARCAVAAATHDPRFAAVRLEELDAMHFELSVLSPPELLADPLAFEAGSHGLIVAQDGRQGLLLPQVATAHGWDKTRFLEETCSKAGLAPKAWQNGAQIFRFTAQVFSET